MNIYIGKENKKVTERSAFYILTNCFLYILTTLKDFRRLVVWEKILVGCGQ